MKRLVPLVCLTLLACKPDPRGPSDTGSATPTGSETPDPCLSATVAALPDNGATDVDVSSDIRFSFSDANGEQDATIGLSGGGPEIQGAESWDGDALVFDPAAPLDYGATYTAILDWSCGPSTTSFTTIAQPIPTAWSADLSGGTFVEPAGAGALVGPLLADTPLLIESLGVGLDTVDLRLAQGNGIGQERCAPTVEALGTDFTTPPAIRIEAGSLELSAQGTPLIVEQAVLTADLDPVAGTLQNLALTGAVDVSTLAPLLGADPCPLLGALGMTCTACPSGPVTCVVAEIAAIPTLPWDGTLQPRTPTDVANDPTCP